MPGNAFAYCTVIMLTAAFDAGPGMRFLPAALRG
jgi:hypothetical protein